MIQNWQQVAFNPATTSTNQIHSDEMAKAYGFRGGLVPGVTISSYLMHPVVLAWGHEWLSRGQADIKIVSPLYDGQAFEVQVSEQSNTEVRVELINEEDTLCASGTLRLSQETVSHPVYRGDPLLTDEVAIPAAVPDVMQQFAHEGMHGLKIQWDTSHNMAWYLKSEADMAEAHRPSMSGYAHGAFLLGITNWVLMGNAVMNPWVHLQTKSQFLKPVPYGTELVAECHIKDLFSKKGHDFVDVGVNLFEWQSKQPVMTAELRAIYRMRKA